MFYSYVKLLEKSAFLLVKDIKVEFQSLLVSNKNFN